MRIEGPPPSQNPSPSPSGPSANDISVLKNTLAALQWDAGDLIDDPWSQVQQEAIQSLQGSINSLGPQGTPPSQAYKLLEDALNSVQNTGGFSGLMGAINDAYTNIQNFLNNQ